MSTCPEFEDLQENNFLEMNFTDLVEFLCMQLGYESLEECYERFVTVNLTAWRLSTPSLNVCSSWQ